MTARRPRKATPATAPPVPRRDELVEALRQRIYELEATVDLLKGAIVKATEELVSPYMYTDEERINTALGTLEVLDG